MIIDELPAFLPGRLAFARGTPADYRALERFHYCGKRPATWAGIWVVRYQEPLARRITGETPVPPVCAFAAPAGWHGQRYSVARGLRGQEPSSLLLTAPCRRRLLTPSRHSRNNTGKQVCPCHPCVLEPPFSGPACGPDSAARVVAVAVLSYPTLASTNRDVALPRLRTLTAQRRIAFLNAHVRTISRVVVHPQFRGVGLASRLARHVCAHAATRYVEAFARMGRVHPFFEKGGMRPMTAAAGGELAADAPVYYLFDRHP
jgi:GNAT superfamily N-acetyltransferase